jgi:hypothetical protein
MRIGQLEGAFLALMTVAGLASAFLAGRYPEAANGALPSILWPVGVSLLFDIVTVAMRGGGLPPLAMPVRAAGVVLAMALVAMLQGRI